MFHMELDPFVSTGAFIKERDPMISNGNRKKDVNNFFNLSKKEGVFSINLLVYIVFFKHKQIPETKSALQ